MNEHEAKRGFLTFAITLVVATGIFLSAYYTINTLNSTTTPVIKAEATKPISQETKAEVGKDTSVFAGLVNDSASPDLKLADSENTQVLGTETSSQVLGAGDPNQSTSGAVPTTGSNTITLIILAGSMVSLFGAFISRNKARAYALKNFENRARKN